MEHPLIAINPGIAGGKPIIKGTRITVEMIADEFASGRTIEQILYSYSHLKCEQVEAALVFDTEQKKLNWLAG